MGYIDWKLLIIILMLTAIWRKIIMDIQVKSIFLLINLKEFCKENQKILLELTLIEIGQPFNMVLDVNNNLHKVLEIL